MPADHKIKSGAVRVHLHGEEIALIIGPLHAKALSWLLRWINVPALADVRDGLNQAMEVQHGKG